MRKRAERAMVPRRLHGAALAVAVGTSLLIGASSAAEAQSEQPPKPRVGVVLSGGSAKGFAHVGVLRILEDAAIPIDVITATSMGGLVGGLYALGYNADQIEQVATAGLGPAVHGSRPSTIATSTR